MGPIKKKGLGLFEKKKNMKKHKQRLANKTRTELNKNKIIL